MKRFVFAYIIFIVFANISVSLAPWMVYVNALFFIGIELTLKDVFQIHFSKLQLFFLVFTGSFITFALNTSFLPVAIASTVAFSVAFLIDSIVFSLFRHNVWYRVFLSNTFGSFADSFVFIYLAPFPFSWLMVFGTTLLKIIGGSVSGYVLIKKGVIS